MRGERCGPQLSHRSDGANGVFADKPAPHRGLQLLYLKWELSKAVGLGWCQLARGLARAFKNLVSAYPRRTGKKTGPEREGTCKCHTAYHRQSWD